MAVVSEAHLGIVLTVEIVFADVEQHIERNELIDRLTLDEALTDFGARHGEIGAFHSGDKSVILLGHVAVDARIHYRFEIAQNLLPPAPLFENLPVVGADDQSESVVGMLGLKAAQGVDTVVGTWHFQLYVACLQFGIGAAGQTQHGHAVLIVDQRLRVGLKWIQGCEHHHHFVDDALPDYVACQLYVAVVDGIERPAENTYLHK